MATYLEQFLDKLRSFEGSVPWMYLDTVGKVTVGTGLMLPNEAAALALPFRVGDRAATPEEIAADFSRVSGMRRGKLSAFYRKTNGLELPETAIAERLQGFVEGIEGYLRTHLKGYANLPDAAKMALLDMAYNLGPGRLFADYPLLLAAIGRGDWKAAAAASGRRGPAAGRNQWTRDQFLQAAKATVADIEAGAAQLGWASLVLGIGAGLAGAVVVAWWIRDTGHAANDPLQRPSS